MALKPCKECNKKISTLAKVCPSCGVPKPTTIKKNSNSTSKQTMNVCCSNVHCTAWLKPAKVPKKKLSFYKCPRCSMLMKLFTKKDKDRMASSKTIYAHCSEKFCRDYSQMYSIPSTALGSRVCPLCKNYLIKAKYENGKPVMPTGGKYGIVAEKKLETTYVPDNSNSNQNSSAKKDEFEKFLDGELDLATSFWGFYFFGSLIVGLVCGYLSEAWSKWLIVPYIIYIVLATMGTWGSAENYKLKKKAKNESEVWAFVAQAMCVLAVLGTFTLVKDTFF